MLKMSAFKLFMVANLHFQLSWLHLIIFKFVWYILKQLFTSVSVKVVDIYFAATRM